MKPLDIRVYGLIGPEHMTGPDGLERVQAAINGGCTLLQYRDKISSTRTMIDNARLLKQALQGCVPLLINDRVDVALASEADGVHLGQDDMHPVDARALLGPETIIGLTLKNADHAKAVRELPLDYTCIGGVFATQSKDNPDPPIALSGLSQLAQMMRQNCPHLPVGAIAGINALNAADVIAMGADGVAVMSELFSAPDTLIATQKLRRIVDEALVKRGALA
jgi:thiamine-phosphate pyrophosphorylase